MAMGKLLEGRRRRSPDAREIAKKRLKARRRRHPHKLERARAGIAQAMPAAAGHMEHRPRDDDQGLAVEHDAPLPSVHEQHQILVEMLADGDLSPGQECFGAGGKRRAVPAWVDRDGHLAQCRRAELHHLAFLRSAQWLHRNVSSIP